MLKTVIERSRNLVLYGHYIPVDYFVFDTRRLVYISVPKVACTSIKIALLESRDYEGGDYDRYMQIHHEATALQYPRLPGRARGYFKFAFVRNPFDRLVSFYEDKVQRRQQHNGRYYFDTAYNRQLIRRMYGAMFNPEMTFEDFVRLVCRVPDWIADAHFKSQYAMLFHRDHQVPDFIGHFESLESDWEHLAQQYDIPPLQHRNAASTRNWRSYYTDTAVIERVAERYRNDLLQLGYEDEYQLLCCNDGKPVQ